eukprot:GEMP01011383.1.p1 GENE.GEMP01011383.1~~GEMP01011383.1.p1  ORF type:complete len:485 (+),score=103.10 GEMP01011383.1:141-1595(+)
MMMVTLTLVVFRSFLVRASGATPKTLLDALMDKTSYHCIVLGLDTKTPTTAIAIPSTSLESSDALLTPPQTGSLSQSIGSDTPLTPEKATRQRSPTDPLSPSVRTKLTFDEEPLAPVVRPLNPLRPLAGVVEGDPSIVISSGASSFIPLTGGATPHTRKTAQLQSTTIQIDVGNVRYHVQQYLGKGKTGFVYLGVPVGDNAIAAAPGRQYAIKFSQSPARGPKDLMRNLVIHDFNIMHMLKRNGYNHVPDTIAMGNVANEGYQWSVVTVVEYIGHDMYYERNQLSQQGYAFSEEDTLWYAIKLKDALRELHDTHHMVHRDIKLANILVKKSPHSERAEDHELFLIDFGTAMRYVTDAGMHVPATYQRNRQGSQQYVSVRVINHKLGGRQDDMHAALLAVLEMKQYLTAAEALERGAQFGANIANFDRAWAGKMAEPRRKVPQALRDLWDMTYNPSLEDTSKWQERPNYELWDRKLRDALTELRV